MKIFALILFAMAASGCQTLLMTDTGQKAIDRAQYAVDTYCEKLSAADRSAFRRAVNPTPGGNSAEVKCADDAE